ncbi:RagB/SusD family nutrient uptake outer membrane protein [Gelidibacter sp. F2691]|nr:RagB/SusD family nutrient uptake outer membrane protein [Gelidibacter sp. F2691]
MKNNIKRSIFVASLFLALGCSEDYLETAPTEFISAEDLQDAAQNNPDLVAGILSGIYTTMVQTGTGGTNLDHDDFGQKGYDLYSDFLSSDVVLAATNYGWYRGVTEYVPTQDFTSNSNYKPWRYYYRIIRSSNEVIATLGGNDAVPELAENRWVLGQAKTLRAHSYFYLTQYFANSYDPSAEILPLYVEPAQEALPRSSTKEVFDYIIADLTDAISLLSDFNRENKSQINDFVAKGVLAYVYGVTGDAAQLKTVTEDIINNGGFPLMSATEVVGGFNDVNTPGWMWGQDITTDLGLDLVSWWGQMDLYTYSYAWAGDPKTIDKGLFDAIPANDVRKGQFFNEPGSDYLMPLNKFYDPAKVIGGQRVITTDYVYMRVAEMYLLNAEAAARLGDEAGARARLGELLAKRGVDPAYLNALSGATLLDEIYLQNRIELWGEGKSYLALKRFKKSTTRGTNHLSNVGQTLPYDDERLTFEIPESEIQNNPFINTQN